MTIPRPDSRLGTDLGPYHIDRVLGRGGMGVVYLAEQRELGRKVALKLLPDELAQDADFRARFDRESKLAASIDHPNIIPLYEAGEIDGTAFLAMRFVDGVDLASRLADGPMEPTDAVGILAQVAGALDAAHGRGLVHRDVKPGNVLLDRTAQGEHAYLTDFGLTKQTGTESGLTRMGSFMGTPAYMAPEQIEGQDVDGRADEYSLACMAFELLIGRVPFIRDQEFAVAMAHVRDTPPSPTSLRPELPSAVDVVFAQAMAKDREARYATCSAFIEDLRSALGGGVVRARPVAVPVSSRRRATLMVAAAIGVGLVAVAGLTLANGLGGSGSGSPSPSGSAPIGAASPSTATPTNSPTPDPSIFPNTAEAVLLAKVPEDLASTCVRGAGKADMKAAGWSGRIVLSRSGVAPNIVNNYGPVGPQRAPKASLVCQPIDGPDEVYFQETSEDPTYSDSGEEASSGVADIATRYTIDVGDCSSGEPAADTWAIGGGAVANGNVTCIPKAAWDDAAWIYWSFGGGNTLGFATRKDADYDALYRWWKNLTLFIE
jgi:serine/threonine protein kinase